MLVIGVVSDASGKGGCDSFFAVSVRLFPIGSSDLCNAVRSVGPYLASELPRQAPFAGSSAPLHDPPSYPREYLGMEKVPGSTRRCTKLAVRQTQLTCHRGGLERAVHRWPVHQTVLFSTGARQVHSDVISGC
jgi:hypothetical protein